MSTLALSILLVAAAAGEWDFTFEVPRGFLVEQSGSSWQLRSPDAEHLVTLQRGPWPDLAALEQEVTGSRLGCALERPSTGVVACAYELEANGEKLPSLFLARVSKRGGGVAVNVVSSPTTPRGAARKLATELLRSVKERPTRAAGHGAPRAHEEPGRKVRAAEVGARVKSGERVALTPFAHLDVPAGFSGTRSDDDTWTFTARDLAVTWIVAEEKPADALARALAAPRPLGDETLEVVSGPERDGSVIRIAHRSARFALDTFVMDLGSPGALVVLAMSGANDGFRRGNATVLFMKSLRPVKPRAVRPAPGTPATTPADGAKPGRQARKDWRARLAGKVAWHKSTSGYGSDGLYVGTQTTRAYHFCSDGRALLQSDSITVGMGNELTGDGVLRGRWRVQDEGAKLLLEFEDGSAEVKQLGHPGAAMLDPDKLRGLSNGSKEAEQALQILEVMQPLLQADPILPNRLQLDFVLYETAESPYCD